MLFTGTVRLRSNTHELTPQIINSPCDDVFEIDLHKCSYDMFFCYLLVGLVVACVLGAVVLLMLICFFFYKR